ncbi:MAG: hypothetical protein KF846_00165 [Cyclobacteriaceae bacterium]|nr:hypothetical protein [Cyclobacteriaceae bacterium]
MPQNHEVTKSHKKVFEPIPQELERIGKLIVDSAFTVKLEPISKIPRHCERSEAISFFQSSGRDCFGRSSLAMTRCLFLRWVLVNPVWDAQILSHLKITNKRLGYLINFNVANIGSGIRRFVL